MIYNYVSLGHMLVKFKIQNLISKKIRYNRIYKFMLSIPNKYFYTSVTSVQCLHTVLRKIQKIIFSYNCVFFIFYLVNSKIWVNTNYV